jgi:hypothetical protein
MHGSERHSKHSERSTLNADMIKQEHAGNLASFPPAPYHKKQMCSQVDDCLVTKRQYFGPFRLNNSVFCVCVLQKTKNSALVCGRIESNRSGGGGGVLGRRFIVRVYCACVWQMVQK